MSSPFPGMDPYLEAHWRDVHTRLMTYICDQIQDQLPDNLVARVEESVSIDEGFESRRIAPDVSVVEEFTGASFGSSAEAVAIAEPLLVLEEEPQTARHVQILDVTSGERVITAIEVLSPTNILTQMWRNDYRCKQLDYRAAGINLVEIDLLRGGQYVLAAPLEFIPPAKRRTYMMCVRTRTRTKVFGAALPEPLPVIPIPLRPRDRDVSLNIQQLIQQVYDRGRYAKLNYQPDPDPAWALDEAECVTTLLRSHGLRP